MDFPTLSSHLYSKLSNPNKDMESTRTSPSQTPSESDDEIWAIVSDKLQIPSHQDPKPLVKSRLRDEVEGVTMGQVGNKLVYANLGGHNFLEDRDEMKQRFNEQSRRFDEISTQLGEHQKRISSLESRVKILTQSSEGYLSIRRRFLDTYKRDIKSMEELKGSKAIQKGNSAAHEGDALGDAEVFNRDQRTDRAIYRELYGLDYTQVIAFRMYFDGLSKKLI